MKLDNLWIYDFEVLKHDWIVCFKKFQEDEWAVFHNSPDEFSEFIDKKALYIGFNSKHYDYHIARGVFAGLTPEELKEVNDYIIGGGQGYQCPLLNGVYVDFFHNADIKDDMQMGLSLKSIEGHLGLPIRESSIPFDIDRPLTHEELVELMEYCEYDVESTEKLVELRMDYLKTKGMVGKLAEIGELTSYGMTNAKLTAKLLKADRQAHEDEREYLFPDNIDWNYVPYEIAEFFNQMYDPNIPDAELFSSKLELTIGECPITIGYGGIHGAIPNYIEEVMPQ